MSQNVALLARWRGVSLLEPANIGFQSENTALHGTFLALRIVRRALDIKTRWREPGSTGSEIAAEKLCSRNGDEHGPALRHVMRAFGLTATACERRTRARFLGLYVLGLASRGPRIEC